MLNFGIIKSQTKQICFNVPVPSVTLPNLNLKIPNVKIPEVGANIGLNFGATPAISVAVPSVSVSTPSLNFGADLNGLIGSLKLPTVICVTVGGKFDLSSILQQITDSINQLNKVNVGLKLPSLSLKTPSISLSAAIPSLTVKLDVNLGADDILKQIEALCASLAISALSSLDPLLALEALLAQFTSLCGEFNFDLLNQVISQIQAAKFQLLSNIIAAITDPFAKVAKLLELATQAIEAGSQDILNMIGSLVNTTLFDSLINELSSLNPADALNAVNAEIASQISLGNFGAIGTLLNAAQYLNSLGQSVANIANATFSSLEDLQNQLNQALSIGDYAQIGKLLQAYDSLQEDAITALSSVEPSNLIAQALPLLNSALQSLDLNKYSRILNQIAGQICTSSIPTGQTGGAVSSAIVPPFLQ